MARSNNNQRVLSQGWFNNWQLGKTSNNWNEEEELDQILVHILLFLAVYVLLIHFFILNYFPVNRHPSGLASFSPVGVRFESENPRGGGAAVFLIFSNAGLPPPHTR